MKLRDLPLKYYNLAREYSQDDDAELSTAFLWAETLEGVEFWTKVANGQRPGVPKPYSGSALLLHAAVKELSRYLEGDQPRINESCRIVAAAKKLGWV